MWTDKQAKRFYNSKEWKAKRVEILTRDNFECQDCRTRLKEASKKGSCIGYVELRVREL